jgi:uncharacterized protein (DUF1800 family)
MKIKAFLISLLLYSQVMSVSAQTIEGKQILHVLNRLAFGPRPSDIKHLESIGVKRYIEEQLNPAKIDDTAIEERLRPLPALAMSTSELFQNYPNPGMLAQLQGKGDMAEMEAKVMGPPRAVLQQLQAARIIRAVHSRRQLEEVMVDFWTNHFNVFAGKGVERWLLIPYDRDTLRPNAMGKFSDLVFATAKSPAMLFYLDNFQSVAPRATQKPGKRRGINENYARELMELHTLGVDGGYTQKDVQEVARCFTGWTIIAPRGPRPNIDREKTGKFHFNPRLHDDGEKIVLGHRIPAGGGMRDGLRVIEILSRHPSTAKFIARKLCRKFVMDNPPDSLILKVSDTFNRTDGDIRETLRAIFYSAEFNSTASYRAKIKSPLELAVSAIRSLNGETDGGEALHRWIARMGEPLYGYQAPTGYPDSSSDWINTGALVERMNFAQALAKNGIKGTRVLPGQNAKETALLVGSPEFQRQ